MMARSERGSVLSPARRVSLRPSCRERHSHEQLGPWTGSANVRGERTQPLSSFSEAWRRAAPRPRRPLLSPDRGHSPVTIGSDSDALPLHSPYRSPSTHLRSGIARAPRETWSLAVRVASLGYLRRYLTVTPLCIMPQKRSLCERLGSRPATAQTENQKDHRRGSYSSRFGKQRPNAVGRNSRRAKEIVSTENSVSRSSRPGPPAEVGAGREGALHKPAVSCLHLVV